MTAEEKLWQLVQRLAEKTAQGAVVWEATAAQNTYQTSFPQYSVRIVELDNQDDYRRPQYMLEMLDVQRQRYRTRGRRRHSKSCAPIYRGDRNNAQFVQGGSAKRAKR
jgi:hypothetical protein